MWLIQNGIGTALFFLFLTDTGLGFGLGPVGPVRLQAKGS